LKRGDRAGALVKAANPVRNSSPAIAGLETERGIISNGAKRGEADEKLLFLSINVFGKIF
jgi:hypothetical protein